MLPRLAVAALAATLLLTLACGTLDDAGELQALAGDAATEAPEEEAAAAGGTTAPPGDALGGLPLVGSVFPGTAGRLHSSLCDPTSDTYSTCI